MANVLAQAAIMLTKREAASIVAATGLIFEQLKKDSPDKPLERVLISQKGGTWGEETVAGVGYPVLRSSNMRGKKVDVTDAAWCSIPATQAEAFSLRNGDILVTKSSGSSDLVGKAAIFFDPNDGNTYLFSNFTLRLRPDKTKVNPEYLAWFLRSPQSLMWRYEKQQTTVGLRNLQTKEYLSQIIPVPDLKTQEQVVMYLNLLELKDEGANSMPLSPPLAEQRRIVARIEALAARVAEAQSLRREASEKADLFVGREIATLFTNAKDWYSYKLGDLTSEVCYGTSVKAHNEREGIPVLRMGNIQSGKLDLSGLKYMHPAEQEMRKLRLQKGDILVNRTNSAELVGKCAVFDLEGDYLFASYIIRVRLDQQKADPYLVAQYINSPIGRAYMFAERKQMTGQANVNSKKLSALPIKLPPLEKQRRLVAYLDGLQAQLTQLCLLQKETQKELSALMPSILDRAFKGEL